MPQSNYLNIIINIKQGKICFTKGKNPLTPWAFTTDEDDTSAKNIRIELGIAKVFHKVLNLIKADPDLFQKEDFELLGEMLAKILFGIIKDEDNYRNFFMSELEQTIEIFNPDYKKICRIYLEFDQKSGVAMLPWEYTLYKTRSIKDPVSFYLSATKSSRFQLIRRVKQNETISPDAKKMFVIVLVNDGGNGEASPPIDSRPNELKEIKKSFKKLEDKFGDSLVINYLYSTTFNQIKQEVEGIYKQWEKDYGQRPYYLLHYVGHSILANQVGKLVITNSDTGKPDWADDKNFASLFSKEKLNVEQPSMVCFQACNSAKIGSFDENLRGVAYEFTKINIPAVIGMQNEINTTFSNAFFECFYNEILEGNDVAGAITAGRDYLGRDFIKEGGVYNNNSFGSPVLFITTEEPIRLIKPEEVKSVKPEYSEEEEAAGSVNVTDFSSASRLYDKQVRVSERQTDRSIIGESRAGSKTDKEDLQRSIVKPEQTDDSSPENKRLIDTRDKATSN